MSPDNATPAVASSAPPRFPNDGFVGPFPLGTPAQMSVVALHLIRSVFTTPGPFRRRPLRRSPSRLAASRAALHSSGDRRTVEPFLGTDLVLWRSLCFSKGPKSMEIP